MTDETRPPNPLHTIWEVWGRRKWLATVLFLLPFSAVLSLLVALPNVYRSTALILVDRQQVPEEFVKSTVTSALETRLQTISQEILSRQRLEGIINRFGLYQDLRRRVPNEEVIERMRRDTSLELRGADSRDDRGRGTVAFTIGYWGSDPQQVAIVTNTLASLYIEENLKVREKQSAGTADFLKVQLDDVKRKLDEQERKVSDFKKLYVGELPQELEVNLATLERLNAQLRLNNDSQARSLERRQALLRQFTDLGVLTAQSSRPGAPPLAPPSPVALRLSQLRQELAELRTRYSDKYPDVVRVRAEIAMLERELASGKTELASDALRGATPPTPIDPQLLRMRQAVDEVEAEIKILKAEEDRLRSAIAGYQRRVQDTPHREQQYRELARDYESTKELYASLLRRYADSQIAESMEQRQKGEQFRILDAALPATRPAAPNRERLFMLGLACSLALAGAGVLLAEKLDSSFHSVDQLRAFTTVPVLVSIPRIVGAQDVRRQRWRVGLVAVSTALAIAMVMGTTYLVAHQNESLVSLLGGRRS
jgi:protein tyrosine kinase modulator